MKCDLDIENDIFTSQEDGRVTILTLKANPVCRIAEIETKETLLKYLDAIGSCEDVQVLLIINATQKPRSDGYADVFRSILMPSRGVRKHKALDKTTSFYNADSSFAKFCNAVNQVVLKIVRIKQFVVYADTGVIISTFLNLGLACDYRIVGRKSIFKNPYLKLGLVPKGGSAVLLSRLMGLQKAYKILLATDGISASEALALGLVDDVVPSKELKQTALRTAKAYANLPSGSLTGIKKLMNLSVSELESCLEKENQLIYRLVRTSSFYDKLSAAYNDR